MFLLLFCQCVFAADDDSAPVFDLEQSPPPRQVRAAGPLVKMTPGQVVAVAQSRLLCKENVVCILGEEAICFLGITDDDWRVLADPLIEFDHSKKRNWIRMFKDKAKEMQAKDPAVREFYHEMLELMDQNKEVHQKRIIEIASAYFQRTFPASRVTVQQKTGGVQLGNRVVVDNLRTYYVKTHSDGRLEEKSSAPKLVKPEELLVYKFLELSGFGTECHFFQRSPEDVYIATLDAAIVNGVKGQFLTLNRCEGDMLKQLTGGLSRYSYQETAEMEEMLTRDPVAQCFAHSLMLTDILARVFRLTDVSENLENFGFTFFDGQMPSLRVIDFRVRSERNFEIVKDHFLGFLEGNGEFNYAVHQQPFFSYILNRRVKQLRFATGLQVIRDLHNKKDILEKAIQEISIYISNTENDFGSERQTLILKLQTYGTAIHHNFDFLLKCFEEKVAESAVTACAA